VISSGCKCPHKADTVASSFAVPEGVGRAG
jgi:hypothetical protein